MKRIVLSVALALLAFSAGAEAQVAKPPNTFPTLAACREALASGQLRFYEPKWFGLRTQNPTNDADRIVVPLESDTCMEMLVVGGLRFVAQREGTSFRAYKRANGSTSLYARDDCGNPVYGVVYPPPPPPPAEPAPQEVRAPVVLSAAPLRQEPPQVPERAFAQRSREREADAHKKKGGFCSSAKCRVAVLVIAGGAGYAAYRFWPCPPGTVRR